MSVPNPFPIEAERGKTKYRMEPQASGFIKLIRINSDGRQETFFPTSMLQNYARSWAKRRLVDIIDGVLK